MMYRFASAGDFESLAKMGQAFYAPGKLFGGFSAHNFVDFWSDAIMSGRGFIIVADVDGSAVGAIGCVLFDDPNSGEFIGQEMFWWMFPEHRGEASAELIALFEHESKAMGATRVLMSAIHGMRHRALGRFYGSRGYEPLETSYIKEI